METKMDLCGKCVRIFRNRFTLTLVAGGKDKKITCHNCGFRRYGATYLVSSKEEEDV